MLPSRLSVSLVATCALLIAFTPSASGQSARATLTTVEGTVFVDDRQVAAPSPGRVLDDATTVRTGNGRAVIALKRGGILALDGSSSVRIHANSVYNFNRIDVVSGSAVIISETSGPKVSCRSDVRLSTGGVFRFDVQPGRENLPETCRFRVIDGAAAVPLVSVIVALRSGQTMTLDPTCGDMIPVSTFDPVRTDDFDRWSRRQTSGSPQQDR